VRRLSGPRAFRLLRKVIGTNRERIVAETLSLLRNRSEYEQMAACRSRMAMAAPPSGRSREFAPLRNGDEAGRVPAPDSAQPGDGGSNQSRVDGLTMATKTDSLLVAPIGSQSVSAPSGRALPWWVPFAASTIFVTAGHSLIKAGLNGAKALRQVRD